MFYVTQTYKNNDKKKQKKIKNPGIGICKKSYLTHICKPNFLCPLSLILYKACLSYSQIKYYIKKSLNRISPQSVCRNVNRMYKLNYMNKRSNNVAKHKVWPTNVKIVRDQKKPDFLLSITLIIIQFINFQGFQTFAL